SRPTPLLLARRRGDTLVIRVAPLPRGFPMSYRVFLLLAPVALLPAAEPTGPPATEKQARTTRYHNTDVLDHYHWLADADNPKVKAWIEAQNRYARAHLDAAPALPHLRKRLKELMAAGSVSYSALTQRGNDLFALKTDPKKDHPVVIRLIPPRPG